jgi:hypothetical protein
MIHSKKQRKVRKDVEHYYSQEKLQTVTIMRYYHKLIRRDKSINLTTSNAGQKTEQ